MVGTCRNPGLPLSPEWLVSGHSQWPVSTPSPEPGCGHHRERGRGPDGIPCPRQTAAGPVRGASASAARVTRLRVHAAPCRPVSPGCENPGTGSPGPGPAWCRQALRDCCVLRQDAGLPGRGRASCCPAVAVSRRWARRCRRGCLLSHTTGYERLAQAPHQCGVEAFLPGLPSFDHLLAEHMLPSQPECPLRCPRRSAGHRGHGLTWPGPAPGKDAALAGAVWGLSWCCWVRGPGEAVSALPAIP